MGGLHWTAEEIERVKALYPSTSWPLLLRQFPGRTKASIRNQAIALGVNKIKGSRASWHGSEYVALRKLYPHASWKEICAAIPRHPPTAIAKQANLLGLKRDRAAKKSRYRLIRELREIRRNSAEPRASVARRIGIHVVQLAKWERGEQHPRIAGFFDWIDALGYRLELRKVA